MSNIFSQFQTQFTPEELEKRVEDERESRKKWFEPGLYEVVVKKAELQMDKDNPEMVKRASDPNWVTCILTFGTPTGEATINEYVMVPLKDEYYRSEGKQPSLQAYTRLVKTLHALQTIDSPASVAQAIQKYIANPSKLEGAHVKIRVGYRKSYVSYEDDKTFRIRSSKGMALTDDTGKELVFGSKDEALDYGIMKDITFDNFVRVMDLERSETSNTFGLDEIPF